MTHAIRKAMQTVDIRAHWCPREWLAVFERDAPHEDGALERRPSEYLRRFTYDTIGHDDRINLKVLRLVGADRVMLGSDYCFDMGLDDPLASLRRMELPLEDENLIAGGNAIKLLRLG